ncbi:GIY-YIG nuclease family protein [Streptomyces sp. NPDC051546]|uniref:GIY-YIG nuclease family protein n=1 Tax=Streptomyces sp. NPDC051546 TaxID=3365655 RepID=UPI0037AD4A15
MTSSTPAGDSSVYVIGSAGSTRVKIGTSVNPEKRLKELQTGNPDRLEVLWCTPGGRELEALLHRAFADRRVEGEWFDFGGMQPIGAIPAAVHQQSETTSRAVRSNARTGPKKASVRSESGDHPMTPERLAGIVRDVVLGVVRSESEREDDDEEVVVVNRRRRASADMERWMGRLYGNFATQHALRVAAGEKGLAALGGWLSLVCLIVLAIVAIPYTAFLMLRLQTRDIWLVRKLPMIAAVSFMLWVNLGFDKLIKDVVLSRLPMEKITDFVRTYFTQAAEGAVAYLVLCSLMMCPVGYILLFKSRMEEQQAKAEFEARHKAAMLPRRSSTESSGPTAGVLGTGLPKMANHSARIPPAPLIAALTQSIPRQPSAEHLDPSTTPPSS